MRASLRVEYRVSLWDAAGAWCAHYRFDGTLPDTKKEVEARVRHMFADNPQAVYYVGDRVAPEKIDAVAERIRTLFDLPSAAGDGE